MTITTKSFNNDPSHGFTMPPLPPSEQAEQDAPKKDAQAFLNNVPNDLTVTQFQLQAAAKFKNEAFETNSTYTYAHRALRLSAAASRVSGVVATIINDGFENPDTNEERANLLARAAAESIVEASLILDEMGYSVETVLKGVIGGSV